MVLVWQRGSNVRSCHGAAALADARVASIITAPRSVDARMCYGTASPIQSWYYDDLSYSTGTCVVADDGDGGRKRINKGR